jgi:hypothetical protein
MNNKINDMANAKMYVYQTSNGIARFIAKNAKEAKERFIQRFGYDPKQEPTVAPF